MDSGRAWNCPSVLEVENSTQGRVYGRAAGLFVGFGLPRFLFPPALFCSAFAGGLSGGWNAGGFGANAACAREFAVLVCAGDGVCRRPGPVRVPATGAVVPIVSRRGLPRDLLAQPFSGSGGNRQIPE